MGVDVREVKSLRQKTEAGLQDCLRALSEAKGDSLAAEELLKAWGLAGVEKRSERETREGRIFIHVGEGAAAMVEIACETDFVCLNASFIEAGKRAAAHACERRLTSPDAGLLAIVADIASVIKENMAVRRIAFLDIGEGEGLETYVHGEGKTGVLLLGKADRAEAFETPAVKALFHDLALHIAAFRPVFIEESAIPQAYKAEQEASFRKEVEEDAVAMAKPQAIREGMVRGRMRKHMEAICLLGHPFVRDEKLKVSEVIAAASAATGFALSVKGFACFQVGEE
jgi:elongation factor Ts